MTDLNQLLVPELTEAAKAKLGLPHKQYPKTAKIPYLGYFEVGDEPYDITDYPEVRKRTLDNVATAVKNRFPLESDRYVLSLENLRYADKDYTPRDEKAALLEGKTLGTRLKGDWVLYDKSSGQVIDRKDNNTLVNVPYLTNRGVFIRNGNEYGLRNMFRLRPGMYTRIKNDGVIATHVNPAQGTGRQSNIMLSPATGVFTWKIGTRNYGVLPLLLDAGVPAESIRKAWGDELFDKNYKKFESIIEGKSKREAEEYKELWDEHLSKTLLDKDTTQTTLGTPFEKLSGDAVLAASSKILRIAQTYTDDETDDRDALQFQTIMGAADYLPERIVRDGGKVFQKILNRIDKDGNLSSVTSGAFQPHVDAVFQEDKHAGYIDGASPIEALDFSTSVSRIGAGGLGTDRAASEESRGVNNSYLGFIDPIRCYAVDTELMTSRGWKKVQDLTVDDELACLINGRLEYHKPLSLHSYDYSGTMYGYAGRHISYLVTPNHRMWSRCHGRNKSGDLPAYTTRFAKDINGRNRLVKSGGILPLYGDESKTTFNLPQVSSNIKKEQVYGAPPQGANLKNIDEIDIVDFAAYLGWYLAEGSCRIDEIRGKYISEISQSPEVNPENYMEIKALIERLPFNTHCRNLEEQPYRKLCIARKQLVVYLSQFGKCADKFIPPWIFKAPLKARLAFRDALLRGDGRKQRHLCTMSRQLAEDFAKLQFELGESVKIYHEPEKRYKGHTGIWVVYWHSRTERLLAGRTKNHPQGEYYTEEYKGKVYCPTVPGGLVYCRRSENSVGFWCHNSPESGAVGLQVYLTHGTKKDSRGRLWTKMIPRGNYGKPVYVDMDTVSKGIVATPEYYDPKADPNEFIPAFVRGGDLEYVRRKNVDYYVADSSRMMSDNTGFISGIGALRSNRTMLGSKASSQALSLPNREVPLVQRYLPGDDGEDSTTEAYMGRKLGAKFAEANGIITRATEDEVVYRDGNGKVHKIQLYNELPANNQGWLSQRPLVKEGDVVKKGQPIVGSNYTDDKGNAAIGVNLKVAMVSGLNAGTALDAITVSESAAKNKLASEQLYKTRTPVDKETIYDKTKFLKTFDTTDFTKEQLDTIGDDGIVMPGTVLQKGDPMVLAVSLREPGIKGIAKHALTPVIERWEHDYPGTVMDIGRTERSVSIYTKALTPAKIGDKMCYSEDTDVLTGNRGWIPIKDLSLTDTVYTLNPDNGIIKLQKPSKVFKYAHTGEMYHVETPQVDLLVTPNHRNLVDITSTKHKFVNSFELIEVSELFGSRAVYKKNGTWVSDYREKYRLPGFSQRCGQYGHGLKQVQDDYRDPETFLPLLGLWLAEGSVYISDGDFRVSIAQKTPEKRIKVEKILNASGYKWRINGTNYIILDKHLALYLSQFGHSYQKYIPEEVFRYSADLQRLFFDGIMLGDGSYKRGRPICYTTTSKKLADDMSRLCLNIGYAGNIQIKPEAKPVWLEREHRYIISRRPCYSVRIVTNKLYPKVHFHHKPSENNHTEEWADYSGFVYCCEVPEYHTLYVRRNDKPCWSGNSTVFGNKGIIAQILPDNEMLQDENGEPFEVYQSPLGLPSRVNPMVLGSLQLGKIAKATGKPIVWKDFSKAPMADAVMKMLAEHGLKESEDLLDPSTGKTVPGVSTGYLYYLKFKHQGDKKEKARGTGDYTMEDLPLKGGHNSARRFGSMEIGAMFGHTGVDSALMRDAKLVRGQANQEFWRAVRNGDAVPTPGIPLVHKKFFEHLRAAGVNLEDRGNRIHMFAATEPDIEKLTGNRQVTDGSTYDSKDLRPVAGGLFDPKIFGAEGDQWAYYQLPEPILNPLMEKSIISILDWKEKDFQGVLDGERAVEGKTGARAIHDYLANLDIDKEIAKAKTQLKSEALPALKRDKILKRYRALEALQREHKRPEDMFISRIPILPPKYRPISVMGNDVGIVSDANYLYKAMIEATEDFKEAKKSLPDEMLMDARKDMHTAIKAVIGMVDSPDKKLQEKGVEGVLKWAFGKGSPKFGSLHRKIFGATVDTGGLAVAAPDSRLGIDEIGLPEESAWASFEPFTVRNLRLRGYSLSDAMKAVEERTPDAKRALEEEMSKRPVLVNRAPTLHKYNILAFWPKLMKGTTIRYNPLVSKGYNVDADGDTMNFHVPVSRQAVKEAVERMLPSKNLLNPATLKTHVLPIEEFSQGLYIASRPPKGKPIKFPSKEAALQALRAGKITYDTAIEIPN